MKLSKIKTLDFDAKIKTQGWVKNHRKQKEIGFIDVFDGSMFETVQLVYESQHQEIKLLQNLKPGDAIEIDGRKVKSFKNDFEISIDKINILSKADEDYPIQPKFHSKKFLREQSHLRNRTDLFRAIFKIRSVTSMAIHTYFQKNDFYHIHTPLITCADCEGEQQMFKLTALDFEHLPFKDRKIDFKKDLFSKPVYITGTGQLHAEAMAMGLGDVYTFGPTLRTEKSHTKVHANEFWMIEAEMAFCDLEGLMNIQEDAIKNIVQEVLDKCGEELRFLERYTKQELILKLEKLLSSSSSRISYEKAIDLLKKADKRWEFEPKYGEDLAKEHERYLAEEYFKGPVFITDWPRMIKPFYCKVNKDLQTVGAVDYILPLCGELSSGSQREDDYQMLLSNATDMNIDLKTIDWYMDLRRFGSVVHSGFGFGLERLLIYLTGMDNIRDVIAFYRTPGNCRY